MQRVLFAPNARRAWAAALAVATVAVFALAVQARPEPEMSVGWDKGDHLLAFGTLAFVGVFALGGRRRAALWVGAGLLTLGLLIEGVQYFIPTRSCDWDDVVADAIGIALGLALATLVARFYDRRREAREATAAAPDGATHRPAMPAPRAFADSD